MAEQQVLFDEPERPEPDTPAPKPPRYTEPIPLAAPDGTVFGYACPRCWQIRSPVHAFTRVEPTAEVLAQRRNDADRCCRCYACNRALAAGSLGKCKSCRAKSEEEERPRWEAWEKAQEDDAAAFAFRLRDELKTWDADRPDPYPLTIAHGRDGLKFFAFPLELDEAPGEIAARACAMFWYDRNQGAPFGYGPTPEAALADLREKARAIQAEARASNSKG